MNEKITKELILKWLENEDDEVNIEQFRRKHDIDPVSSVLKVTMSRLAEEGIWKRLKRGWYRKVAAVEPIKWWNGERKEPIKLVWPYGIEDQSSFGFDDSIEVYPGDSIVIAGNSNLGKTAWVLNLMVNNLHLFEGTRMMVNEYKPQRFRDRMNRFTWVDFWDGDKPKFEVLPVPKDHQDYIKPNYMNLIDWILMRGEFWEIAGIMEDIQMPLREGIVVIVLQKTGGKQLGTGGDWGLFLPAAYFTIDPPGKLTVIKVKSSPKGHATPEGKTFAFDIVERGSQFHNIREVKTCSLCKGSKFKGGYECDQCLGKGYVDK